MGLFDSPETKTKQKTVQKLSPEAGALQTLLARYLLMRLQALSPEGQTFGQFRQQGFNIPQLDILPQEGEALPGTTAAPQGVNPILLNRNLVRRG